jgi:hypothetical protein
MRAPLSRYGFCFWVWRRKPSVRGSERAVLFPRDQT